MRQRFVFAAPVFALLFASFVGSSPAQAGVNANVYCTFAQVQVYFGTPLTCTYKAMTPDANFREVVVQGTVTTKAVCTVGGATVTETGPTVLIIKRYNNVGTCLVTVSSVTPSSTIDVLLVMRTIITA